MSLKIYCQECGQPTEYTLVKARFCAICGKSFSSTAIASAPKVIKPKPASVVEPLEEEEEQAPAPQKPSWITPKKGKKPLRPSPRRQSDDDDDDDDDEIIEVPQIDGLDMTIEASRSKEKIGEIIGTLNPKDLKDIRRPKETKILKGKRFWAAYEKEAGEERKSR